MISRLLVLLLALCFFSPVPVLAQDPSVEPIELGASGEDYLRSIRFRRIDSDVAYFDPTRPAPELTTSETPRDQPREREERLSPEANRSIMLIVTILILGTALYFIVRHGGASGISFGSAPLNADRRNGQGVPLDPADPDPASWSLQQVMRLTDRREALVALSRLVLGRAVAAQGVVPQRSWTARDALRRVPASFDHRSELQALVLASERVQFGGRDVTEDEFRAHVEQVRPLCNSAPT